MSTYQTSTEFTCKIMEGDPNLYFRTHLLKDCCPEDVVKVLYPMSEWERAKRDEELCKRFSKMYLTIFKKPKAGVSGTKKVDIAYPSSQPQQRDKVSLTVERAVSKYREVIRGQYGSVNKSTYFLSQINLESAHKKGVDQSRSLVVNEFKDDVTMKNKALKMLTASYSLEKFWIQKVNYQKYIGHLTLICNRGADRARKKYQSVFPEQLESLQNFEFLEEEEINGKMEAVMTACMREFEEELTSAREWLENGVKKNLKDLFSKKMQVWRDTTMKQHLGYKEQAKKLFEMVTNELHLKYKVEMEAVMVNEPWRVKQEHETRMKQCLSEFIQDCRLVGGDKFKQEYMTELKKRMEDTFMTITKGIKRMADKTLEVYSKDLQTTTCKMIKQLSIKYGIEKEASTRLEMVLEELFKVDYLKEIIFDEPADSLDALEQNGDSDQVQSKRDHTWESSLSNKRSFDESTKAHLSSSLEDEQLALEFYPKKKKSSDSAQTGRL